MTDPIITISREYGSGGREIGKMVASNLGISFYDRELIDMAAQASGVPVDVHEQSDERLAGRSILRFPGSREIGSRDEMFNYQAEAILKAAKEPCVIVGRCADFILRGRDNLVRFFIYSNRELRKRRIVNEYGILPTDADGVLRKLDKERAAYYNYHTDYTWGGIEQFDLCINTSTIEFEDAAKIIEAYVKMKP